MKNQVNCMTRNFGTWNSKRAFKEMLNLAVLNALETTYVFCLGHPVSMYTTLRNFHVGTQRITFKAVNHLGKAKG